MDSGARKKLHASQEHAWIQWLQARNSGGGRGVVIGNGDDAAAWTPPRGESVVLTVDCQVDEVHFRRAWSTLEEIGYRAVAAAVSDLAAMAAKPGGVLLSVVLPSATTQVEFRKLYRGLEAGAEEHATPILGGNLSSGPLSVSVTAVGSGRRAALRTRDGARVGDSIWVTGNPGLARLGLLALDKRGSGRRRIARSLRPAIDAFRHPRARIPEALHLARYWGVRAMIDLSDGLAGDLGQILSASSRRLGLLRGRERGLGAELWEVALGESEAVAAAAKALRTTGVAACLAGGEDYELCFTVAARRSPTARAVRAFERRFRLPVRKVGTVTRSDGLRLLRSDGAVEPVAEVGWDHFG